MLAVFSLWLASDCNVVDQVDIDPVVNHNVVGAILRVNLLPEIDTLFQSVTRKCRIGCKCRNRRGNRQKSPELQG